MCVCICVERKTVYVVVCGCSYKCIYAYTPGMDVYGCVGAGACVVVRGIVCKSACMPMCVRVCVCVLDVCGSVYGYQHACIPV